MLTAFASLADPAAALAVFAHADGKRLGRSHADDIRVHWPDGHYTDGIDAHLTDLKALFVWAPDTRIVEHPLRLAQNGLTAITGVMRGTFTRPMPDGKGGLIQPTGRAYALNMCTVGIWNRAGRMSEEFLFWHNLHDERVCGSVPDAEWRRMLTDFLDRFLDRQCPPTHRRRPGQGPIGATVRTVSARRLP